MSTGDLKNNLITLMRQLKVVNYKDKIDQNGMSNGESAQFLGIYRFMFTVYSQPLVAKLAEMDAHLANVTDTQFVDIMYRVMRDLFDYKPMVPKDKFFSSSFAERKVLMCTDVVSKVREYHQREQRCKTLTKKKGILSTSLQVEKTECPSKAELLTSNTNRTSKSSSSVRQISKIANQNYPERKKMNEFASMSFNTSRTAKYAPDKMEYTKKGKQVPHAIDTVIQKKPAKQEVDITSSSVKVSLNSAKSRGELGKHKMQDVLGKTPVNPNVQTTIGPDAIQKGDLFSMIASHDDRLTALENFIQQLPQQDSGLYVPLAPGTTLTLGQKREVLALIDHAIDKWSSTEKLDINQNVTKENLAFALKPLSRTSTVEDLSYCEQMPISGPSLTPVKSVSPHATKHELRGEEQSSLLENPSCTSPEHHMAPDQGSHDKSLETEGKGLTTAAVKDVVVQGGVSDSEASPAKPGSASCQVWMTFAKLTDSQREEARRIKQTLTEQLPEQASE